MKVLNLILNIPKDVLGVPHLALQSICNLVQDMGHIGHLLVAGTRAIGATGSKRKQEHNNHERHPETERFSTGAPAGCG